MTRDLRPLLGPYGVARAADLAGRVDRHTVTRHVAGGRLLRPHRGVVAAPACWDDWRTRALAGVLATGGVLSHATALAVWRVLEDGGHPVHVSVPSGRRAVRGAGLVVPRARYLEPARLRPFPATPLPR